MVIVKERKEKGKQEGREGGGKREGKKKKVSKEKGVPLRET